MLRSAIKTVNARRIALIEEAHAVVHALAEEMRVAIPAGTEKFVEAISDARTGRRLKLHELIVRIEEEMSDGKAFTMEVFRSDLEDVGARDVAGLRTLPDALETAWPTIQFRLIETTDRLRIHIYAAA